MRVSLTLRSTSKRQTEKRRSEKGGETEWRGRNKGESMKLDYNMIQSQNNVPRHFTGKCVR